LAFGVELHKQGIAGLFQPEQLLVALGMAAQTADQIVAAPAFLTDDDLCKKTGCLDPISIIVCYRI
jgi:hypothetical protein